MHPNTHLLAHQHGDTLFDLFEDAALEAGKIILQIYQRPMQVEVKGDGSPVTQADQAAERVILSKLRSAFASINILAEEAHAAGHRSTLAEAFFLVDPLDGTKEFVLKNGEFTVNIALIEGGKPTCGVVFAPDLGVLYFGGPHSAFKKHYRLENNVWIGGKQHALKVSQDADALTLVTSRSHPCKGLNELFDHLNIADRVSVGSSLKFCLIAEGKAHLYPRLTPTMEWDTGAGQAVLEAAGGVITTLDGTALGYHKAEKNYLNPFFIAANSQATAQKCAKAFKALPQDLVIR